SLAQRRRECAGFCAALAALAALHLRRSLPLAALAALRHARGAAPGEVAFLTTTILFRATIRHGAGDTRRCKFETVAQPKPFASRNRCPPSAPPNKNMNSCPVVCANVVFL